jgi:hypothetical protein
MHTNRRYALACASVFIATPMSGVRKSKSLKADVLGRLGTPLTDEQESRFRALHDMLLRHTLSQSRAVGRFLRQAAAYLPMVDPGELDVVDFLALTHLRSIAHATDRVIAARSGC